MAAVIPVVLLLFLTSTVDAATTINVFMFTTQTVSESTPTSFMEKEVNVPVTEALVCSLSDLTNAGVIDGEYTILEVSCGTGETGEACASIGFDNVQSATGEIVAVMGPLDTLISADVQKAIAGGTTKPLLLSQAAHVASGLQWNTDFTTIYSAIDLRTELIAQVNYVKSAMVPSVVMVLAFAPDAATRSTVTEVFTNAFSGNAAVKYFFFNQTVMNTANPAEIAQLNAMVGTYCDALFLVGQPTYYHGAVLESVWHQPQLKMVLAPVTTTMLMPSALAQPVSAAGNGPLTGPKLIFTASFPFPRLETGADNPEAVTKYLTSQCGGTTGSTKGYTQAVRFQAWMSFYALLQMLIKYPSATAAPFVADMQQLNRFMLADLPFGDLAGNRTNAIDTDHFSFCDQGSRRVYYGTGTVSSGQWSFDPPSDGSATAFALPYDICSMQQQPLYYPIPVVLFTSPAGESGGANDALIGNFMAGASSGWDSNEYLHLQRHRVVHPATSTSSTPIVTSYMPKSVTMNGGPLYVDPFTYPVSLNEFRTNELHFLPTLEQQLMVIIQYFASQAGKSGGGQRRMQIIIRRAGTTQFSSADALSTVITKLVPAVLGTEGKGMQDLFTVSDQTAATQLTPAEDATDVVVLGGFDPNTGAGELIGLLKAKTSVALYIPFEEYSMFYTALTNPASGGAASVAPLLSRVHFVSNMVSTGAGSLSTWNLQEFVLAAVTNVNSNAQTPATNPLFERGNMTAAVLDAMAKMTGKPSPTSAEMLASVYYGEYVAAHGTVYGPFTNNCGSGAVSSECLTNYGARNINLWTHTSLQNGQAPLFKVKNAVIPDDLLDDNNTSSSSRFSTGAIIGFAFAGLVALLLLLLFILLIIYCCTRTNSSNNKNAPKDPSKPVTLIFTDIESSTALWATVPAHMAKAVKAHHKVMREVISKHGCYEVKTIGDSFMIACRSAAVAVALAAEAQERLHALNWGTDEIDGAYRTLAAAKARKAAAKGGAGVLDPDWALPPEEYARRWNGLRVRIGMHTGLCDAVLDEVTRRYDYYGTTVNVAARTEALGQGGQVLCTEATHAALTPDDAAPFEFTYVGAHPLRGVTEPVGMYQLTTVPGRQFVMEKPAPLDPEKIAEGTAVGGKRRSTHTKLPYGGVLSSGVLDMPNSGSGTESVEEEGEESVVPPKMAYEVLDVYFSAYESKERAQLLVKTCKHLSIEPPPRRQFKDRESWMEALIKLLATRTTAVIDYRHQAELEEQQAAEALNASETQGGDPGQSAVITSPAESSRLRLYGNAPVASTPLTPNPLMQPKKAGDPLTAYHSQDPTRPPRHPVSRTQSNLRSPPSQTSGNDEGVFVRSRPDSGHGPKIVFDNGDVVELRNANSEASGAPSPISNRNNNNNNTNQDDPDETASNDSEESLFEHGRPTVDFDRAVSCIRTPGGKIFRLTSNDGNLWAFYNDTTEYKVVVAVSIGKNSDVTSTGPALTLVLNDETGKLEGEMVVRPLQTQIMLHGTVKGFKLHYSVFNADPFSPTRKQ